MTRTTAVRRPDPVRSGPDGPAAAEIWWWLTEEVARPGDPGPLTAAELAAAARRPADRRPDFTTSRAAVRRVLGALLDVPPERVEFGRRPCPECADAEHGPPYVRHPRNDLWISISHTRGCGLLAVAGHPVGADVEHGRRRAWSPEMAAKALTPAERAHVGAIAGAEERNRAFLRCWTRKEAVLKAVGTGIVADLSALETRPADPGPVPVRTAVPGVPARWRAVDLVLPAPYLGSLAYPDGAAPPVVRLHRFTGAL